MKTFNQTSMWTCHVPDRGTWWDEDSLSYTSNPGPLIGWTGGTRAMSSIGALLVCWVMMPMDGSLWVVDAWAGWPETRTLERQARTVQQMWWSNTESADWWAGRCIDSGAASRCVEMQRLRTGSGISNLHQQLSGRSGTESTAGARWSSQARVGIRQANLRKVVVQVKVSTGR